MTGPRGSHAPSLLTHVRRALAPCGIERGARVLVACSGGPDSTALLHALALLHEKVGFALVAHGVDHGLRAEAAAELDVAEGVADAWRVPFARTRVAVALGGNLQARARAARYEALRAAAADAGASLIATGHTADDRAETVLMRLVRGTGPRGLAVLPHRAGDLVRPLLRASRRDVALHLSRHSLPSAIDASNADRRFVRARIRHDLMPILDQLSPKAVQAICALADDMVALREAGALAPAELDPPRGHATTRRDRPRPSPASTSAGSTAAERASTRR